MLAATAAAVLCASRSDAATLEEEVVSRLNGLRSVEIVDDAQRTADFNAQMDAAWQYFAANEKEALPVLRAQLRAELALPHPNDLVLLDVGLFLYKSGSAENRAVALDALERLDMRAPIVTGNRRELFDFLHAIAQERDPRVLGLTDRAFLTTENQVVPAPGGLRLDNTLLCVFVFGTYGPAAEDWLRNRLADKAVAKRVLEVLVWLGSPAAVPEAAAALDQTPDHETFMRVTTYMMQSAGPAGRGYMLSLDPARLETQSRDYLTKVRRAIQDMSAASFRTYFYALPGDTRLPDDEVARRVAAMIERAGKDDRTNPQAILDSGLPADRLIEQLTEARRRTFLRVTNEALGDAQITGALIAALRYRGR